MDDPLWSSAPSLGLEEFRRAIMRGGRPYLSPPDTLPEMAGRRKLKGFNFPYVKDPDGSAASSYGVTRAPEIVVLDGDRRVRYQGRVMDARDPARARRQDLQEALDDLLAGEQVEVPETEAFGCSIGW